MIESIYESSAYKRSRKAYFIQCAAEYFVSKLIEDAFLAKLLKSVGLSDSTIGIISSMISFAFLAQLGTIFLVQRIRNIKRTVILIDMASMFSFLMVYLVPFLPLPVTGKTILLFVFIGGGFMLKYLQLSIYYKWGNSFVSPAKRGRFTATNEFISLIGGIIFLLAMGYLVDRMQEAGNLSGSFILLAAVILVLALINLAMLLTIKKPDAGEAEKQQLPLKEVLKNTLGNRNYASVIVMTSVYEIARYLSLGFLGTFKTEDLLLSVGAVQIINVASNALRASTAAFFGKLADRTSFAKVHRYGLIIQAVSFLFLFATTPKTWWMIIAHTAVYNVGLQATGGNANNMTYSYVPLNCFVQAQAIRCSIGGVLGFLASLVGSRILSAIQANGNMLFGIPVYGQQILGLLSFLLMIAAVFINKFVVSRQKVMKQ